MDFHDKAFFDRLMALTEENNALLKKIRQSARISQAFRVAYWFIIIGLSIGAFYFIQPMIDQLMSVYTGFQDTGLF